MTATEGRTPLAEMLDAMWAPSKTMAPLPGLKRGAFERSPMATTSDSVPWVVDANELRDDILRNTRIADPTMLLRTASSGVVRFFCAPHVVAEVDRHLPEWAAGSNVDPAAAASTWDRYRHGLLRQVDDDPTLEWTGAERDRLGRLECIDPEDVPTARLAITLQARLASKDRALLEAVYGRPVTVRRHHEALVPALAGASQLDAVRRTQEGTVALGGLSVAALVGATRRWPGPAAFAAGALIGALMLDVTGAQIRRALHSSATAATEIIEAMGGIATDVEDRFDQHPTPPTGPGELVDELGPGALLRVCLWRLARLPAPNTTAAELSAAWPREAAQIRSIPAIRGQLRATAALCEVSRGRFQLGRPIR